jgi:hypothetical protein
LIMIALPWMLIHIDLTMCKVNMESQEL